MEGTGGFYEAFKDTCDKHQLQNIIDYCSQLPWYDGDLFDSEPGDLLVEYGLVELGEPDTYEDELIDGDGKIQSVDVTEG